MYYTRGKKAEDKVVLGVCVDGDEVTSCLTTHRLGRRPVHAGRTSEDVAVAVGVVPYPAPWTPPLQTT
jgi:hypothetical protein